MSAVAPREKRLAEAVAILMEAIHHAVPGGRRGPSCPMTMRILPSKSGFRPG
jgi:hypothetical protein